MITIYKGEVIASVMKTDYCEFTFSKVTLTAPAKSKLIIDGTLDIECNY